MFLGSAQLAHLARHNGRMNQECKNSSGADVFGNLVDFQRQ
jgi:hypothetical protein